MAAEGEAITRAPLHEPPRLVSVISPAYNEEAGLGAFTTRVAAVLDGAGLPFEIVFVNDGSTDRTLATMRDLAAQDPHITVLNLSRNFGKEIAMTAGIGHASGDVLIIIDTDLQDPPELIPAMVQSWREGFDVVYGQRTAREGETWIKKLTARLFYRLVRDIGPVPLPESVGDFRLISRRVAKALLMAPERRRFMKGLYAWVGFPQTALPYTREARFTGDSKWNYWKLWNFALDGITSFTTLPLKVATYVGLTLAMAAFGYGAYVIVDTLMFGNDVQGFPALITVVLFLGGMQLVVLGVIGEYLGRIFDETKQRPLYFVESLQTASVCQGKALVSDDLLPRRDGALMRLRARVSKFALVGGLNTGIDFAVFTALVYGLHAAPAPANVVSFLLAVTNSYVINRFYTFKDRPVADGPALAALKFLAVSMIGLAVSTGAIVALTPYMPALLAKVFATGASMVVNYLGVDRLVFRRPSD